jgi:hypothetical protein
VIKDVTPLRQARLDAEIGAGKSVTRAFDLGIPEGVARVRLLYKLYPHVLDSEARVLADVKVGFP